MVNNNVDEVEYALDGEKVCYRVQTRYVKKQVKIKPRAERIRSSVHDSGDMRLPSTSMWSENYDCDSWEHRKNKDKYSVMDGGVG